MFTALKNDMEEQLQKVEELIAKGELEEAQKLLDAVKENSGAKYFLQGKLYMEKSWYSEAYKQYKKAVKAEPDNEEYRAVFRDLENFRKSEEYRLKQKGQMGGAEICAMDCCEICGSGCCEAICDGCS